MAVYERTYKRHTGPLTPLGTRFLVLPRYIFREVFKSRWMLVFFTLCFVFPLLSAVLIHLSNNADFLAFLPEFELPGFLQMNAEFFDRFLRIQGGCAFAIALFVGPGLISKDLANNGLPLYLSRPFTRTEYVLGKISVLAIILSLVTWVPALLLMTMHANYVGFGWLAENARIVLGVFVGSWIWILTLGLLALAISAWVKWRPVAAFAMLFVMLAGEFFGSLLINSLFRTDYGSLISLRVLIREVWSSLLGLSDADSLPIIAVTISLGLLIGFLLFLLYRKIRAYEVVK